MQIVVEGRELPGLTGVQVALQVRQEPVDPVPAESTSGRWVTEVRYDGGDVRGPAVHGRRGERFLYLTWGEPSGSDWRMFRRAKLMLSAVDPALLERAAGDPSRVLVARLPLTDACGGPLCAAVRPPTVTWSVEVLEDQASDGRSL